MADGVIYFGASIWPSVGSFLHAVDAGTGKAVWVNSGSGAQWTASYSLQGSGFLVRPGMYGNTPQGYLWSANTTRQNAATGLVGKLVDLVFDGSAHRLVAHLLESDQLSDQEREELRRLIDTGARPGK